MPKLTADERRALGIGRSWLPGLLQQMTSPWFRFYLGFDPGPVLRSVRCPVLAINGSRDAQVLAAENLRAIGDALRAGGNANATIREIPGLNHLFQSSETGAPTEYARIETTIAPEVLSLLGEWIAAKTKQ